MAKKPANKMTNNQIQDTLKRYKCPVPYHAVRTRFLGQIASPDLMVSPMREIQNLWGGSLPELEGLDAANDLISVLVDGLWNSLSAHQKRNKPFRLFRFEADNSPAGVEKYVKIRLEEIQGFWVGLFNGQEELDFSDKALRKYEMVIDIEDYFREVEFDFPVESKTVDKEIWDLQEMTLLAEKEMHNLLIACTIARRQQLDTYYVENSTIH